MRLLPLKFRLIEYFSKVENGTLERAMDYLNSDYGDEKQYNEKMFRNHLLTMKENGIIKEIDFKVIDGKLEETYAITEEGQELLKRYMPKNI